METTNATKHAALIAACRVGYQIAGTMPAELLVLHSTNIARAWREADEAALFDALHCIVLEMRETIGGWDRMERMQRAISLAYAESEGNRAGDWMKVAA